VYNLKAIFTLFVLFNRVKKRDQSVKGSSIVN